MKYLTAEFVHIKPSDIDSSRTPIDTFGKVEREISARWVLQLAQRRGHWGQFTLAEIESLYNEKDYRHFTFNDLDNLGFLRRSGGPSRADTDTYEFSLTFVTTLFGKYPAANLQGVL
jgi:hypothetical protein